VDEWQITPIDTLQERFQDVGMLVCTCQGCFRMTPTPICFPCSTGNHGLGGQHGYGESS
jgi:hypothetical protein